MRMYVVIGGVVLAACGCARVPACEDPVLAAACAAGTGDSDGEPSCTALGCACDKQSCDTGLTCVDGSCELSGCGDGVLTQPGELCDDGNTQDGDGCDNDCTPTTLSVHAGRYNTCALIEGGRVKCWGDGRDGLNGQGGVETIGNNEVPSTVAAIEFAAAAVDIDLGGQRACGTFADGAVRCWGYGGGGGLGYGNLDSLGDDEMLGLVGGVELLIDAVQVSVGRYHSCAHNGWQLSCWGANASGQLGIGSTQTIGDDESPSSSSLISLSDDIALIGAGGSHNCALTLGGALVCWGNNVWGQLGYGHANNVGDNEPATMYGPVEVGALIGESIVGLALGYAHTCVLNATGMVRCWGRNDFGQLGLGNVTQWGDSPGETPGLLAPIVLGGSVVSLSAGLYHTCALIDDGSVRCWGRNDQGQLGLGSTDNLGDDELPNTAPPINLGGQAIQLSAAGNHSCAVLEDYSVVCWGQALRGQLGYGNTMNVGDDELPVAAGFVSVL